MRKNVFGIVGAFVMIGACASCHPPKPNTNAGQGKPAENMVVGGQKDEFGCPVTAGYTWSYTRKDCVRIWEVGGQFDDLRDKNSALAIFLIQNGDSGDMELYLPESPKPIILEKMPNFWQSKSGEYRIEKRNNGEISIFVFGSLVAKGIPKL